MKKRILIRKSQVKLLQWQNLNQYYQIRKCYILSLNQFVKYQALLYIIKHQYFLYLIHILNFIHQFLNIKILITNFQLIQLSQFLQVLFLQLWLNLKLKRRFQILQFFLQNHQLLIKFRYKNNIHHHHLIYLKYRFLNIIKKKQFYLQKIQVHHLTIKLRHLNFEFQDQQKLIIRNLKRLLQSILYF